VLRDNRIDDEVSNATQDRRSSAEAHAAQQAAEAIGRADDGAEREGLVAALRGVKA
jgi:hypothetical protein